ncbi:sphingolipid delta-4 desaturase [Aureococcus anophagefferens]|nr:sphingolipid delta-4 desaturase [Aureococcus anophagefferens]
MGKGGRKQARRSAFHIRVDEEPHAKRRTEMLKKYPEIKKLYRFEPRTKYIAGATVALQLAMAVGTRRWGWLPWLAAIYVVGATANHSLFLAIHELAHNLGAKSVAGNRYIAMMANIPICIAYSVTPMFTKPDLVPFDKWIATNWAICLTCDALLVAAYGTTPLFYLLLSTFFAGSIHPTAGHFISEHYVMDGTAETYSYYGVLNYLTYNVGYHNEHHDFPAIPGAGCRRKRSRPNRRLGGPDVPRLGHQRPDDVLERLGRAVADLAAVDLLDDDLGSEVDARDEHARLVLADLDGRAARAAPPPLEVEHGEAAEEAGRQQALAFTTEVKEGKIDEYLKYHDEIWPDVAAGAPRA